MQMDESLAARCREGLKDGLKMSVSFLALSVPQTDLAIAERLISMLRN
jgi:hypothetical protein